MSELIIARRQRVAEVLRARPGAITSEIGAAARIGGDDLRVVLDEMILDGEVVAYPFRQARKHFLADDRALIGWTPLGDETELLQLLDFLVHTPGATQKDILAVTESWDWARTTTQWRLARLVRRGHLIVVRQGRSKRYSPTGR